jgi:hypothetical protein
MNTAKITTDILRAKKLAQITLKDKTAVNATDALNCIQVVMRTKLLLSVA